MKLIRSFGFALQGILYCFRTQANFRYHTVVLALVTVFGLFLGLTRVEWTIIIICAMLVITTEIINTAIEALCDTITLEINPHIKIIKDASAGAVFISALGSVLVGCIILLPKLIAVFYK